MQSIARADKIVSRIGDRSANSIGIAEARAWQYVGTRGKGGWLCAVRGYKGRGLALVSLRVYSSPTVTGLKYTVYTACLLCTLR